MNSKKTFCIDTCVMLMFYDDFFGTVVDNLKLDGYIQLKNVEQKYKHGILNEILKDSQNKRAIKQFLSDEKNIETIKKQKLNQIYESLCDLEQIVGENYNGLISFSQNPNNKFLFKNHTLKNGEVKINSFNNFQQEMIFLKKNIKINDINFGKTLNEMFFDAFVISQSMTQMLGDGSHKEDKVKYEHYLNQFNAVQQIIHDIHTEAFFVDVLEKNSNFMVTTEAFNETIPKIETVRLFDFFVYDKNDIDNRVKIKQQVPIFSEVLRGIFEHFKISQKSKQDFLNTIQSGNVEPMGNEKNDINSLGHYGDSTIMGEALYFNLPLITINDKDFIGNFPQTKIRNYITYIQKFLKHTSKPINLYEYSAENSNLTSKFAQGKKTKINSQTF